MEKLTPQTLAKNMERNYTPRQIEAAVKLFEVAKTLGFDLIETDHNGEFFTISFELED